MLKTKAVTESTGNSDLGTECHGCRVANDNVQYQHTKNFSSVGSLCIGLIPEATNRIVDLNTQNHNNLKKNQTLRLLKNLVCGDTFGNNLEFPKDKHPKF